MQLASGDPIDASMFGVKFLDEKGFSSFSKKLIFVVHFLNNGHLHITDWVSWHVEMHTSGLLQLFVVDITSMLIESLL